MAYKTKYFPKNPKKYIGDISSITCRSLWERHVCKFLDENSSITKWSSEEIAIPYYSPVDKKIHNYYPDFLVEIIDNKNNKQVWLLEVKPKKQTFLKENASKKEIINWSINTAKWKAAENYCQKHNIKFKIMTEKDLFSKSKQS
jgi:hypothetical protein